MFCENNFQPLYLLASDFLQTSFNTLSIKLNTYLTWEHSWFRIACFQEYKLLLLKPHRYLLHNFQTQKMFTLMNVSTKQRRKKPTHGQQKNPCSCHQAIHTYFFLICPTNNLSPVFLRINKFTEQNITNCSSKNTIISMPNDALRKVFTKN